jgi:hypothetical protein
MGVEIGQKQDSLIALKKVFFGNKTACPTIANFCRFGQQNSRYCCKAACTKQGLPPGLQA